MSPSIKHTIALVVSLLGPALVAVLLQIQAIHPEWTWLALITPALGNIISRWAGNAPKSTAPAAAIMLAGLGLGVSAQACTPAQQAAAFDVTQCVDGVLIADKGKDPLTIVGDTLGQCKGDAETLLAALHAKGVSFVVTDAGAE